MGQEIKKNLALKSDLWIELLKGCESKMFGAEDFETGERWTMVGVYLTLIYVLSLRGPEGFQIEISLLRKYKEIKNGLVWIPLVGKLKGDTNPGIYLLGSVPVTGTGIDIREWRDRLLAVHDYRGRIEGLAICDEKGFLLSSLDVNECMWEVLEELYDKKSEEFPVAVETKEMIEN